MSSFGFEAKRLLRHAAEAVGAVVSPPVAAIAEIVRAAAPADIVIVAEEDMVEKAARAVGYAQIAGSNLAKVEDVAPAVLRAAHGRPIRSLFIGAHGDNGAQLVSSPERGLWLQTSNVAVLAPLVGHFAPGALVTLGGCNVGQGKDGEEFVGKMAATLGVTVQASTQTQFPSHGLEGTHILVCKPDAHLSTGYQCETRADELVPAGDHAGNLSFGSPLRVASDVISIFSVPAD